MKRRRKSNLPEWRDPHFKNETKHQTPFSLLLPLIFVLFRLASRAMKSYLVIVILLQVAGESNFEQVNITFNTVLSPHGCAIRYAGSAHHQALHAATASLALIPPCTSSFVSRSTDASLPRFCDEDIIAQTIDGKQRRMQSTCFHFL